MTTLALTPTLKERAELVFANRALVEEVQDHNLRVIIARRRGDLDTQYRNVLRELGCE